MIDNSTKDKLENWVITTLSLSAGIHPRSLKSAQHRVHWTGGYGAAKRRRLSTRPPVTHNRSASTLGAK